MSAGDIAAMWMDEYPFPKLEIVMKTTEATYEADLQAAQTLIQKFLSPETADGNGRNWINAALNNTWAEGLTVSEWVARAVVAIPAGFLGNAS